MLLNAILEFGHFARKKDADSQMCADIVSNGPGKENLPPLKAGVSCNKIHKSSQLKQGKSHCSGTHLDVLPIVEILRLFQICSMYYESIQWVLRLWISAMTDLRRPPVLWTACSIPRTAELDDGKGRLSLVRMPWKAHLDGHISRSAS